MRLDDVVECAFHFALFVPGGGSEQSPRYRRHVGDVDLLRSGHAVASRDAEYK
ncbi:hypothetical protein SAMN04487948_10846 [Halogranum amylolyticum]|uniref:Uncharacterized protein n=1 Tax=Halogranum amylolyticum TaxID=660520 RepID=A0A1H8TQ41_9EURY|nr:hypothetical protein SAMN04487948_10846 [Halogranum amylolyticum]